MLIQQFFLLMSLAIMNIQAKNEVYYSVNSDRDLLTSIQSMSTIERWESVRDSLACLNECTKSNKCGSASFSGNYSCRLYSAFVMTNNTRTLVKTTLYSKKASLLQRLFQTYVLTQIITNSGGINLDLLRNFEIVNINSSINYLLVDYYTRYLFIYDDKWQFKSKLLFGYYLAYIKFIENELYFTSDYHIFKSTLNGTMLAIQPSKSLFVYQGSYYNETSQLLYVASYGTNRGEIQVYNRNLTWLRSIDLGVSQGYRVEAHNGRLYASGLANGNQSNIFVFENEILVNNFTVHCVSGVTGFLFDSQDYMAIVCENERHFFLYDTNGNNYNKTIFIDRPYITSVKMDAYDNLVVSSIGRLSIYSQS